MKCTHDRKDSNLISSLPRRVFMLLCVFIIGILPSVVFAQDNEAEEIIISLTVKGMGTVEMPALINGEVLYLPVADVFDYLKIKNEPSAGLDTVKGFYITQDAPYLVDKPNNIIFFKDQEYKLTAEDLVKTETSLYLKTEYFDKIFGLQCTFNFRALVLNMTTKLELPVIREARLETMRRNVSRLSGNILVDTAIPRSHQFFHFGTADWSIIGTQQQDGLSDTRLNLALGASMLGGELDATVNYSQVQRFNEKQQFYLWRYVDNDNKYMRQVTVGKVSPQTVASVYAPVVGIMVSNTPTAVRRTFGSYILSNITEPGWVVELYVNNVLVDYTKADATGFFKFEVPLFYGNSVIKLQYYGPFGEERSKEETVSIPFNFLPKGKLEYTASAGVVEDDSSTRISRETVNYGLSKRITFGGGVEYLSSVQEPGNVMPFANASFRLGTGLLIYGEHNQGVRTKGGIFYRTPSSLQVELTYTAYQKGQKAINNNALEERKVIVSMPLRTKKISMFSMLTVNQTILSITKYTNAEWLVSGSTGGIDARVSTIGLFTENISPLVYSNLSASFRIFKNFLFTPETQYQYSIHQFISAKALVERRLFKYGYAGFSYERNFKSDLQNIALQFRYDFSFTQVGVTSRYINKSLTLQEAARGSVILDKKTNYVGINNSTNIGRGGIVLAPFLDLNCNGKKDAGERKVSGLKFRITGGRVMDESKDTTIRVLGLETSTPYYIELNRFSFDNIAWQIPKRSLKVYAEPNGFRRVEIPVAVVAEASGMVYIRKHKMQKGQGQVYICFYKDDILVARTLSEPDGYFSYMGLAPGSYKAMVDTAQMRKINMTASPAMDFEVEPNPDGSVIDNLEFVIQSNVIDTVADVDTIKAQPVKEKAESKKKANPVKRSKAKAAPKKYKPATSPLSKQSKTQATKPKTYKPHKTAPKPALRQNAPVKKKTQAIKQPTIAPKVIEKAKPKPKEKLVNKPPVPEVKKEEATKAQILPDTNSVKPLKQEPLKKQQANTLPDSLSKTIQVDTALYRNTADSLNTQKADTSGNFILPGKQVITDSLPVMKADSLPVRKNIFERLFKKRKKDH